MFVKDCLDPTLLELTDEEMAYLEQVYGLVSEIGEIEDALSLTKDEMDLMERDYLA